MLPGNESFLPDTRHFVYLIYIINVTKNKYIFPEKRLFELLYSRLHLTIYTFADKNCNIVQTYEIGQPVLPYVIDVV